MSTVREIVKRCGKRNKKAAQYLYSGMCYPRAAVPTSFSSLQTAVEGLPEELIWRAVSQLTMHRGVRPVQ